MRRSTTELRAPQFPRQNSNLRPAACQAK